MELFTDLSGHGTYATRERAVARAETTCRAHPNTTLRYVIIATAGGRFAPAFRLDAASMHLALDFASQGICVL